jgi:predicted MPP superfamily phosphohydrolase
MSIDSYLEITNENFNKLLEEENNILKKKIEDLEQKLKKYTNGDNHKRYYEKNKDKIKINGLSYLKNLKLENPEKIKEYNHNAYIKRKEKKNIVKEKIEPELNTIIYADP